MASPSSSSSSPLPYAAYLGNHRRVTSSRTDKGDEESRGGGRGGGGSGGGVGVAVAGVDASRYRGADNGSSPLQRPTISISQVQASPPPPPPPPPSLARTSASAVSSSMGSGSVKGPPPLRTVSSLRSASGHSASSNLAAKSRAKLIGGEASSSSSIRTESSSLAIPTTPSSKTATTSSTPASPLRNEAALPKLNGHSKRHSYSPLPSLQTSSHSRSVSGSVIPHHISTAQRLRTVDSTPTNASSNASSPTGTPRNQSPSMEAMLGGGPFSGSTMPFAGDAIGRRTAYRPGFQPRGTYRVRTDEFTAAREKRGKGRSGPSTSTNVSGEEIKIRNELESQRLERRLEKLLALHYDSTPVSIDAFPSWLPNAIRKTRQVAEEEKRIREEEMRIVKWEDDYTRKVCPLCSTPFSLSIRKHHCRLCGRIVCASPHLSLPPGLDASADLPPRKADGSGIVEAKCSSLVIADSKGGTVIKDMPGWDEGILEDNKRGIRICRECRETIMRRQYMLDDGTIPAYLQLYESLVTLQKEIEQSLPEFQEMVLGLQKQDAAAALGTVGETVPEDILSPGRTESSSPSALTALKAKSKNSLALQRDAAQARKQLLANFANYDLTAKKIRNLDDQGNVSLARVKLAIWAKANLFLQQNMFPLQSLPKLTGAKKKPSSGVNTPTSSGNASDAGAESVRPFRLLLDGGMQSSPRKGDAKADARAAQLVQSDPEAAKESLHVLEQQLGLVLEYAASAAKARKFQDAKSLKMSAQDLEVEIARLRRLGIS